MTRTFEGPGPRFFGWYDPDPKKAAVLKIEEGLKKFRARWNEAPGVVLVGEADVKELEEKAGWLARVDVVIGVQGHLSRGEIRIGPRSPEHLAEATTRLETAADGAIAP